MVMNFNSVGTNKKPGLILYGLDIVYRLLDHIVMCPSYPTLIPNFATPKDVFNINIYVVKTISMFMLYELATHLQQSHCKLYTSSCAYLQRYMYLILYRCLASKKFRKTNDISKEPPPPLPKKIPKSKNKAKKETNNGSFGLISYTVTMVHGHKITCLTFQTQVPSPEGQMDNPILRPSIPRTVVFLWSPENIGQILHSSNSAIQWSGGRWWSCISLTCDMKNQSLLMIIITCPLFGKSQLQSNYLSIFHSPVCFVMLCKF